MRTMFEKNLWYFVKLYVQHASKTQDVDSDSLTGFLGWYQDMEDKKTKKLLNLKK